MSYRPTSPSSLVVAVLTFSLLTSACMPAAAVDWAKVYAAVGQQQRSPSRRFAMRATTLRRSARQPARNAAGPRKVRGVSKRSNKNVERTRRFISGLYGQKPSPSSVNGHQTLKPKGKRRDPKGASKLSESAKILVLKNPRSTEKDERKAESKKKKILAPYGQKPSPSSANGHQTLKPKDKRRNPKGASKMSESAKILVLKNPISTEKDERKAESKKKKILANYGKKPSPSSINGHQTLKPKDKRRNPKGASKLSESAKILVLKNPISTEKDERNAESEKKK